MIHPIINIASNLQVLEKKLRKLKLELYIKTYFITQVFYKIWPLKKTFQYNFIAQGVVLTNFGILCKGMCVFSTKYLLCDIIEDFTIDHLSNLPTYLPALCFLTITKDISNGSVISMIKVLIPYLTFETKIEEMECYATPRSEVRKIFVCCTLWCSI